MNLNKITATAAMAGGLGAAALGIGAGLAQAGPDSPNVPGPVPGPHVPGPDVRGPNVPDQDVPGHGQVSGQPVCNPGAPGVNCNVPGSPLPPGHDMTPPPGHYNDPDRYGLPATWTYNGQDLPIVYNPVEKAWGVNASDGFHVYAGPGAAGGQTGGQVGVQPGT